MSSFVSADVLAHDGWELHGAYHWMVAQAKIDRFVMVMPDVTVDYGGGPEVAVYRTPYTQCLRPLVSPYAATRRAAFTGLAMAAHAVAEAAMHGG